MKKSLNSVKYYNNKINNLKLKTKRILLKNFICFEINVKEKITVAL